MRSAGYILLWILCFRSRVSEVPARDRIFYAWKKPNITGRVTNAFVAVFDSFSAHYAKGAYSENRTGAHKKMSSNHDDL